MTERAMPEPGPEAMRAGGGRLRPGDPPRVRRRRPRRSRPASAARMPLLTGRPAHRRRGRRPQPAPAGHHARSSARCAARRSRSTGSCRGLALEPALLRPGGAARPRAARRAGRQPAFDEVKHALGRRHRPLPRGRPARSRASRAHHAGHVGTGLANGHSAAARDFETIRTRARGPRGARRRAGRGGDRRPPPRPGAAGPRDRAARRGACGAGRASCRPRPRRDPQGAARRRSAAAPSGARGAARMTDGGLSLGRQRRPAAQGVPHPREGDRASPSWPAASTWASAPCTGCSPRWSRRG